MKREPGGWQGKRGSRHERGYGYAWTKRRKRILERDGHACQICASRGKPAVATEVDHIKPKAKGGTDDDANLQAVCKPCHQAKTLEDAGQKPKPAFGLDGWPE